MDSSGFDYESLQNAREYARIQDEINSGLEGYIDGVKKVKTLSKDLQTIDKNINELKEKTNSLTGEELKMNLASIDILKRKEKLIEREVKYTKEILKTAKKWDMLGGSILASTVKTAASLDKIPSMVGNIVNKFKDLFEMDKAIRQASLEMGLINKQSDVFRKNIESAASNTISFGVGIKELAEMQSQYSDSIGRNVSMGQKDLEALAEIAKGTSLGAEATTKMAADFEAQGVSALKTKDYIQEAVDNSSAMGLNTSKVMSNLSQNVKMLNKYRFKDGVKGLVKMSELSTKLGVSMEFASSFADKLWDVEGAVETSAQLQVMGGAFARLADPFKLMYMARNDIAGLTEELANAASESATFNSETGKFDIAAMEMHRLKIIAQQTGISYEELTTAAQNAAKFAKLRTQIPFKLDKEAKEFIENTAQFDKNGKAYIQIGSEKKFLSQLGASGQALIQQQMSEKKSLKERAEASQSFDESLTNLINMVKMYMMPIVEGITGVLKPLVEKFMNDDKLKGDLKLLGENIGKLVEWGATKLKWFTETIVDTFGVNGIFAAWLGAKGILMAFDAVKWFANGLALSKGFLKGTGGMGGAGAGTTSSGNLGKGSGYGSDYKTAREAGFGRFSSVKEAAKLNKMQFAGGAAGGALAGGINSIGAFSEGKTGEGIGNIAGGVLGGALGTLLDPFLGPFGTMLGAQLGSMAGGAIGGMFDEPQNDVKFPKLGPSHSKNRMLSQNGRITPIHNKDELLAIKPGGVADKTLNNAKAGKTENTKVEFGEMVISGEIKINVPGGTQIGTELMKSQEFKTAITRVVTSQLEKNINGGKNKG